MRLHAILLQLVPASLGALVHLPHLWSRTTSVKQGKLSGMAHLVFSGQMVILCGMDWGVVQLVYLLLLQLTTMVQCTTALTHNWLHWSQDLFKWIHSSRWCSSTTHWTLCEVNWTWFQADWLIVLRLRDRRHNILFCFYCASCWNNFWYLLTTLNFIPRLKTITLLLPFKNVCIALPHICKYS